jgi:hypothetical protein
MTSVYLENEGILHRSAMAWLAKHNGYEELVADDLALGDRMDSAGRIGDRAVVIEVKTVFSRNMAAFDGTSSGVIESKIAAVLRDLYGPGSTRISKALSFWKGDQPPIAGVLAGRFSEGSVDKLCEMFAARSADWLFDWRIWQWDGAQVLTLASQDLSKAPAPNRYASLNIPSLSSIRNRKPKRPRKELDQMFRDAGTGHLYDKLVGSAKARGWKITNSDSSVLIAAKIDLPEHADRKQVNILGVYPSASSERSGLCVGASVEYVGVDPNDIPGLPLGRVGRSPSTTGLQSFGEIEAILLMFDPFCSAVKK